MTLGEAGNGEEALLMPGSSLAVPAYCGASLPGLFLAYVCVARRGDFSAFRAHDHVRKTPQGLAIGQAPFSIRPVVVGALEVHVINIKPNIFQKQFEDVREAGAPTSISTPQARRHRRPRLSDW
jgi:hypothetical protein